MPLRALAWRPRCTPSTPSRQGCRFAIRPPCRIRLGDSDVKQQIYGAPFPTCRLRARERASSGRASTAASPAISSCAPARRRCVPLSPALSGAPLLRRHLDRSSFRAPLSASAGRHPRQRALLRRVRANEAVHAQAGEKRLHKETQPLIAPALSMLLYPDPPCVRPRTPLLSPGRRERLFHRSLHRRRRRRDRRVPHPRAHRGAMLATPLAISTEFSLTRRRPGPLLRPPPLL